MNTKNFYKLIAKKTGKTIKQIKAEEKADLKAQLRCEFCGEKGHAKKNCTW